MRIHFFGKRVNIHPCFGQNFLDATALNTTGSLENEAMQEILRRAQAGEFTLLLPYSMRDQIALPDTPSEVKRKAQAVPFSLPVQLTELELASHQKISSLLQANVPEKQGARDAFYVVESAKNDGRNFITTDKRLLKNALEIWQELHLRVINPIDFIEDYFAQE